MNRRNLLTALAITALLPKMGNAKSSHGRQSLKIDTPTSLDLRDAPLPLALELLLGAYGFKAQVDSGNTGFVTLKTTDQPLETNIDLVKRSAHNRLEVRVENGVYTFTVGPQQRDPIPLHRRFLMAINNPLEVEQKQPPLAPRTVLDIPRRVCGVFAADWDSKDDFRAAILVTGEPENFACRIVRAGDRIPSGLPDTPDLRVVSLSANGITLETQEGDVRFLVRLRGLRPEPPRVPKSEPRYPPASPSSKSMIPTVQRQLPDLKAIPQTRLAPKPKVSEGKKNP